MRNRVGDTLIEVTLAIGIFSLVAITIVAVMNGGTSSTQTALETTLAREEIDTQAEAIRFIHDAYMADIDSDVNTDDNTSNTPYVGLWREMTGKALDIYENENIASLLTDTISCNNIYDDENALSEYAFVINPRKLNEPESAFVDFADGQLTTTQTYPRLIYSENNNNEEGTEALISDNSISSLKRAEGIYVVPVFNSKDETVLIKDNAANPDSVSTYYDFYIRTCWYGTGDDIPSSISTIVRLYDPEALASSSIKTANKVKVRYSLGANATLNNSASPPNFDLFPGESGQVENSIPVRKGYRFLNWSIGNNLSIDYQPLFDDTINSFSIDGVAVECNTSLCSITAPNTLDRSKKLIIKANWERLAHKIIYNLGENGTGEKESFCYLDTYDPNIGCRISETPPTYPGRDFVGYTTIKGSKTPEYSPGGYITNLSATNPEDITLYAIWKYNPDTLFLVDSTGSMSGMIKESKAGIKTVGAKTLELGGKVALYEYRDYRDKGYDIPKAQCVFGVCNSENLGSYVDKINVGGGGDEPESLLAALYYVMDNLSWTEKYSKAIIVITDASYLSPDYLTTDKNKITYNMVITKAKSLAPLKIYVVTTSGINGKGTYNSLTSDTGGKVVTTFDNLNDIITE